MNRRSLDPTLPMVQLLLLPSFLRRVFIRIFVARPVLQRRAGGVHPPLLTIKEANRGRRRALFLIKARMGGAHSPLLRCPRSRCPQRSSSWPYCTPLLRQSPIFDMTRRKTCRHWKRKPATTRYGTRAKASTTEQKRKGKEEPRNRSQNLKSGLWTGCADGWRVFHGMRKGPGKFSLVEGEQ